MPRDRDDAEMHEEDEKPQRSQRRRENPPIEEDWEDEDDRPRRKRRDEEGDATGGLIPYKNPKALIGYYCGVFSLIPVLGLILGPTAIVLGLLGMSFARRHPTASGTGHAVVALVLGGLSTLAHLGCVVFSVVGISTSGR
jgi:hypothetical protein